MRVFGGEVTDCDVAAIAGRIAGLKFEKLAQLLAAEPGLGWRAAADDVNIADTAFGEGFQRMTGDIGPAQFVRCFRQDARDIERDVAMADDRHGFAVEIEVDLAVVRMAIVPGDEIAGAVAAREALPEIPRHRLTSAPVARITAS